MRHLLPLSSALFLLLAAGCNKSKPDGGQEQAAPASAAAPDSAAALRAQVAAPQAGDVYVVQFQPPGAAQRRYFFYHVFRVTPDSAYLHPARKDAADAAADLAQPDFQASANTMAYSRAELAELLQEQPGDVNKARLVQVRRAQ
ncbi:hypothetical protein SAMN02745146_2124 [Hymenobacter daecheongensis DSM 21074]|uniref:Lipoprotein n=1 Tax=Hymenobacter daecheongensis DSM 21074 TaxID=1121955 RepID=A0A1M6G5D9_9BACT|nr:hypothetical protein [Hymenobacter daecheongensis]SHJ05152.1 hypothetical protein SAMN02745146_2124 [Hymenobacter daecheongensis DSM 21074]